MKATTHKRFNADDVLRMAERAEQNAAEVYTKAADLHADTYDVALLRALADMEYKHKEMFAAMRERLSDADRESPKADPYLKSTLEFVEMVYARAGEGRPFMVRPLAAKVTLQEIIQQAIMGELETVAFYDSLRALVPGERGKKNLDRIIAEEKGHVVALRQRLLEIEARP
jgi:rubrerythrin